MSALPLPSLRLTVFLGLVAAGAAPVTLKYGGLGLTAAYLIGLAGAGLVIAAVSSRTLRLPDGRWQAAALAVALAAAFAIGYPIAQSGLLGPGSDRDEALSIAIQALLEGRFPYWERTYFNNPISPLPGALLIGLPFHLLGSVAVQNVVITLAAGAAMARALRDEPARWLLLGLATLGNPGFMQDYVTGGDYAVNALYVGAALWAAVRAVDGGPPWRMALMAALLGVAVCSRPIYAVAGVILVCHGWHRRGPAAAVGMAAVLAAVAAILVLPFYLYDPAGFSPLHVANKLPGDAILRPVLLLTAITAVAVLSFRPLPPSRLFAVLATGLGIMLVPAALILAGQQAGAWGGVRAWTAPLLYILPTVLCGAAAAVLGAPAAHAAGVLYVNGFKFARNCSADRRQEKPSA